MRLIKTLLLSIAGMILIMYPLMSFMLWDLNWAVNQPDLFRVGCVTSFLVTAFSFKKESK